MGRKGVLEEAFQLAREKVPDEGKLREIFNCESICSAGDGRLSICGGLDESEYELALLVVRKRLERNLGSEPAKLLLQDAERAEIGREAKAIEQDMPARVVSAGIPGFEKMLPGLPRNATILLVGEPGSGKSSIARQFVMEGLAHSEPCLWVVATTGAEEIMKSLTDRGVDPEPHISKGLLRIVDAFSPKLHGAGVCNAEQGDLSSFSVCLATAARELADSGPKRLVFDSLSKLFLHNPSHTVFQFLEEQRRRLNELGFTGLWILEQGAHSNDIMRTLGYLSDGTIAINRSPMGSFIRVSRMRDIPISETDHRLILSSMGQVRVD